MDGGTHQANPGVSVSAGGLGDLGVHRDRERGFREVVLVPTVGEYTGHVLSTAMLILAISVVTYLYFGRSGFNHSRGELSTIGAGWFILIITFEFLVGFLEGATGVQTLGQYDVLSGRVWIAVPIVLFISPFVFGWYLERREAITPCVWWLECPWLLVANRLNRRLKTELKTLQSGFYLGQPLQASRSNGGHMRLCRRDALRLAGLGGVGSLAGCIDNYLVEGRDDPGGSIDAFDTIDLGLIGSSPAWHESSDELGAVFILDGKQRTAAALARRGILPSDETLASFLDGVDFDRERLVLVESVGPNLCHRTIDIGGVEFESGALAMDASVQDDADDGEVCPQAVAFPATLVRVTFGDVLVDEVSVELTDGWDESTTIQATVDDPIPLDPERLPGHISPGEEPEPVAPLVCEDEPFERHPQGFDAEAVHLGDLERGGGVDLALRVDASTYELGETVHVRLVNVADEPIPTGNRQKYNLQVYTETGWEDVRGADEGPFAYTDEAVNHPPGEGFTWSFELTEEGIVADSIHDLRVCPELAPGRYRFAFFGIGGEGALSVEFDVTS